MSSARRFVIVFLGFVAISSLHAVGASADSSCSVCSGEAQECPDTDTMQEMCNEACGEREGGWEPTCLWQSGECWPSAEIECDGQN